MSTQFSNVTIKNDNSIGVEVTVEAPKGTVLPKIKIEAALSGSVSVNLSDIQSAKLSVETESHDGYIDTMNLDFEKSGLPYPIYIENIYATVSIGSIHGTATIKF